MVQKIGPEENNIVFKFGGGLHTRASPDEIDGREAADGFNFLIDIQNRNLRNRPPFDLIGTVPNAASIRGGASLLKTDGTVTSLIQAGNTVYQWNGGNSFTSKGSCSATCKLRGHWRTHVWNLTDVVLITDLTLTDTIYKWDGSTFGSVTFTDQAGGAFGNFYAKYLSIVNEQAIFSNIKDGSGSFPHMIVGSKVSDYTKITIVNQPSSSIGTGDPFYLLAPDLKPINGAMFSFGAAMISTERGMIFNLTGTNSQNYDFSQFYDLSAATGVEAVTEIGNDIMYGRQGRIESIRDTNTFGNSQSADLTAIVADHVGTYSGWTLVFNSRTRKAYCLPTGVSQCWVLDAAIRDSNQLSPWMQWQTSHSMAFQPTMVMSMLDPADGLEYIIMGDSTGHLYRMEGTGSAGDGGTNTIDMQFLSKLVSARLDAKAYDYEGYIKYAANLAATAVLTFINQGESVFDKQVTVPLSAATGGSYYSGGAYYGDAAYYSSFSGKMTRNKFSVPGHDNDLQLLVEVAGVNAVSINEVGLRFRAAS